MNSDEVLKKLSCPCCGVCAADNRLVLGIRSIFGMIGHDLSVNSGCRCKKHNAEVGGAIGSQHLVSEDHPLCKAVDLGTPDPHEQEEIVDYARKLGFGGIGWGNKYLHLDLGLPREWRYGADGKPIYKKQ